jgi:hypothetical protein
LSVDRGPDLADLKQFETQGLDLGEGAKEAGGIQP